MLHQRLRRRIDAERQAAVAQREGRATGAGGARPRPSATAGAPVVEVEGPWQVRRAGLVDVNPIARLLQAHRPFIDLDGDGEPDEAPDPEQAGSATRLVLSHGALEHGEVWFAEDGDGVAAVAVWMPPDGEGLAQDLHRVVARELGEPPHPDPELAHAPLRSLVGGTAHLMQVLQESDSQRVLILLADAGRAGAGRAGADSADADGAGGDSAEGRRAAAAPGCDRRTLLADVLAPVVTSEVLAGRSVLAVTVDPAQVADLEALGFAEVSRSPLGAASLWLGALRPPGVDDADATHDADGASGPDGLAQAAIATV